MEGFMVRELPVKVLEDRADLHGPGQPSLEEETILASAQGITIPHSLRALLYSHMPLGRFYLTTFQSTVGVMCCTCAVTVSN